MRAPGCRSQNQILGCHPESSMNRESSARISASSQAHLPPCSYNIEISSRREDQSCRPLASTYLPAQQTTSTRMHPQSVKNISIQLQEFMNGDSEGRRQDLHGWRACTREDSRLLRPRQSLQTHRRSSSALM